MLQFLMKHTNRREGLLFVCLLSVLTHLCNLLKMGAMILGNSLILSPNTVCSFNMGF